MKISKEEIEFIKEAKIFLDSPSLLTKISDYLGKPIEYLIEKLPKKANDTIISITNKALQTSLKVALKTLPENDLTESTWQKKVDSSSFNKTLHNIVNASLGAAGGFFGEIGLLVELPISTSVIMRSILTQGRSFKEISDAELISQSIFIFTLGSSNSDEDDDMNSSYFSSRVALQALVSESTKFLAANSAKNVLNNIEKGSVPVLIDLIAKVAARFEVNITEKMIAESIPVVGAIGGAGINLLFTEYFTSAAKYHFGILSLEEKYGQDTIREHYNNIQAKNKKAS